MDRNVYENWPVLREYTQDKEVYLLDASESRKTLEEIESLYEFLFKYQTVEPLIAIGGGITGDLAGYASATFKRGIPLILLPTTLLAMCDSTVGGKCGVNYKGVKNYIGTFKKPDEIFICTEFLTSLPERHLKSGMGEILKYGLIGKEPILPLLEKEISLQNLQARPYVEMGLKIKIDVVSQDFYDRGQRNVLNFGHNIAHGLEAVYPNTLTHGEAVALGLLAELRLSEELFGLRSDIRRQTRSIMERFGMMTVVEDLPVEKLLDYIKKDKKNDDSLRFTLLRGAGCPEIKQSVAEEWIRSAVVEIME
ncbi:3-dehydroquinate synthase [Proteiniclasticum ruminis]|uniref:3-dehydroquinate synthase n=1 Tax=Proteiniclasticum ruminis TaxID=398199 RepID=A0A1I4YJ17_9CLOT|nr:3-dehydroquinate synthase [Proteiniclasticum ruminis]